MDREEGDYVVVVGGVGRERRRELEGGDGQVNVLSLFWASPHPLGCQDTGPL